MPHSAYIVDCVRTAGGKRNGALSKVHPIDLGAHVVNALLERNKVDGNPVDDVIFGCVSQIGGQSGNLGRNIVLASRLPEAVPGTVVDRQCGSSLQAFHFAAQAVMSGTQDVVICGGVESMSTVPIGSNVMDGIAKNRGAPITASIREKYTELKGPMFSQFEGAELLAKKYNVTREDMDKLALLSHQRAEAATQGKHFANEIVPFIVVDATTKASTVHDKDEGIRSKMDLASLQKLPVLKKDPEDPGRITAGTSSQICDGASAVLVCNEAGLKKLGLKPRAKVVALALAGSDPVIMLYGPVPATKNALQKANLKIGDIDLYEVNEAFASVPLAWAKEVGADINKLNVNGGALALGHPLGGTGTKLIATLVNELERRKQRYGLLAICEGGGTANATIIERCAEAPKAKL
jgi:acetyl-CoA acetyltransferase family protein